MQLTHTKRAAIGFVLIAIFAIVIWFRRGQRPFGQQDYVLIGAALFLVTLNVVSSYYFDVQKHKRGLKKN